MKRKGEMTMRIGKSGTLSALQSLGAIRRDAKTQWKPTVAGLLAQKGCGSATYYVPTDRLGADGDGLPTKSVVLSTNPEGLPTNPEAL